MPFYSEEIIDEVRNANDIVDVISQYVQLKKKGASYFGLCPFHNEKSASFSVSREKQMYYCFGCGAGGNVITFLRNYDNMTFPEALKSLADRAGIALPEAEMTKEQRQRADRRSKILAIYTDAARYYFKLLRSETGKDAYNYFKGRKLSDETMRNFGLGYSPRRSGMLFSYLKSKGYEDDILKESGLIRIEDDGRAHDFFWNRAMFPIFDANGKVIAFGGRIMGEGDRKYLNSLDSMIFDKSRTLYGLHLARRTRRKEMILCEGYMDVIALHQAGFDNAVATLGTALTAGHAGILKRYTKDVYLSYDSDGAGVKAAMRAIPILKEAGITCKIINMRPHKDPDEFIKALGKEAYEERIREAENSFLFTIRIMEKDYDLNDPEESTKFWRAVAGRILEFPEELERHNYVEAICRKYEISTFALEEMITNLAAEGYRRPSAKGKEEKGRKQRRKQASANDGLIAAQRLFLTRLCDAPDMYERVRAYISPENFSEGVYRDAAGILFMQIETTGNPDPAAITEKFADDAMQRELGAIFNTTGESQIGRISTTVEVEEASERDQQKMMWEVVLRLLRESIQEKEKIADETGEGYDTIIAEKRKLQELEMKKSL